MVFECAPDPHDDLFCGWIFNQVIEAGVIQHVDDVLPDDPLDSVEVFDHAACRPVGLKWAANGNVEPVGMSVHPGTLARVVWENVRRFKAEVLANLHVETAMAFATIRKESVDRQNQP